MKITDPDIIKNGEKDLIDAVKEDLDLDIIKQILEKKITAAAMSSKGGQIIVHNNEIAFKLDFDLNLSGSLMFDRQGNYIPETGDETDPAEMEPEDDGAADEDLDTQILDEEIDSENFDLDDTLDETPDEFDPAETGGTESEYIEPENLPDDIGNDIPDDLEINLPDYDLEDEEQMPDEALESLGNDGDSGDNPELENETDEEEIIQDDMVHDDINDILKESQEFWDKKDDQ